LAKSILRLQKLFLPWQFFCFPRKHIHNVKQSLYFVKFALHFFKKTLHQIPKPIVFVWVNLQNLKEKKDKLHGIWIKKRIKNTANFKRKANSFFRKKLFLGK